MEQKQVKKPNPFKLGTGDDTQDVEGWGFDSLSKKVDDAKTASDEQKKAQAQRDKAHAIAAQKKKAQTQESIAAIEAFRLGNIFDKFCGCFK
jgi:hypothetical protein